MDGYLEHCVCKEHLTVKINKPCASSLCKIVTLLFIVLLFFLSITINRNTTKNTHSRIQVDFLRLNDTTPNKLTHGFSANFQYNAMNFSTTKGNFVVLLSILVVLAIEEF